MGLAHNPKIVTDGLVLCLDAANLKSYPGSGTTWKDLSGNGNDGTLTNGVGYSSDNKGSLTFDGVDEYLDFGELLVLASNNSEYSVEFFFKTNKSTTVTSPSGLQNFIGHASITDDIQYLCIRNKKIAIWNKVADSASVGWYSAQTEILTTKVYHLVITFDGTGNYKVYLDGILDSNWPNLGITDSRLAFSQIGRLNNDRDFDGKIYTFKAYNKSLSQAEIQQNFAATRGRYGI